MRSIYQAANSSEWTPGDSTVPLGHGVPGKLQQMDYIHTNKYIYTLYLYTSPYHTTAVYKCSVPSSSGSQQPLRPMCFQSHRRLSLPDPESRETGRVPNSRHRRLSSTFLLLTTIVTTGTKLPRVPFDRHGNCHDFRVAARRERTTVAERSERVQVPESSDPEERRAE